MRHQWQYYHLDMGTPGAWAYFPGAQPTEQPRRVPRWRIGEWPTGYFVLKAIQLSLADRGP